MGWNGSNAVKTTTVVKATSWRPALWRGVLVGLLVVIAVGTGVVFVLRGKAPKAGPVNGANRSGNGRLATVDPEATPTNVRKNADTSDEGNLEANTVTLSAVAKAVAEAESSNVVKTNEEVLATLEKYRREPVKGLAEQLLVMVAPMKKGDFVPPPPIGEFDEELEKQAEEALEKVGQVEDWDTEQSIAIKERLELLKDEWYAAKSKGLTFHAFILGKLDQAQGDTEILDTATKMDEENFNDRALSDEDYLKSREKVDEVLTMQGFDKLPERLSPEEEEAQLEASDAEVNAAEEEAKKAEQDKTK